jgi:hypothetical protein
MQTTQEVMESTGLGNEQTSKKRKSSKPKSEIQMMIPPKKGRGRRTAVMEQSIAWIVAAAESFAAGPREEWKEIPPVICLPCLDIKDIKFEEPVEKPPEQVISPHPDFTSPPKAASSQNGRTNHAPLLKVQEPKPTTQDRSDLDKDLVAWMKVAFNKYIVLAGQEPNLDREWGYRLAQVAVGFDVMADGTELTKEVFPDFVGALFELVDLAGSTRDLDLLKYITKNSVYLDVLAEAAEFKTRNGAVSINFQNLYDDKYLTFTAAVDLLKGRAKL